MTLAAGLVTAGDAVAFPHVVRSGETLAEIAERMYGRVELEQVLVAANALDLGGGAPVTAGMRLEIPAVGHHRVTGGESWEELADLYLGERHRYDALAAANDAMPWVPPADGAELIVPYNLRYVARDGDTTLTIAYRFLGERDKAWMLDRYNRLKGEPIRRGDVVLVPLTDLPLTEAGRDAARSAGALVRSEGLATDLEAQRAVELEMPKLALDVREGRFIDAITRGNRMMGAGELTRPQVARIERALTEAYVAMGAEGLAETACLGWRKAEPEAELDPIELSPKIIRVCTKAINAAAARGERLPAPPPPAGSAATPASPPP